MNRQDLISKIQETTELSKTILTLQQDIQAAKEPTHLSKSEQTATTNDLLKKTETLIDKNIAYGNVIKEIVQACQAIDPEHNEGKTGLHILVENANVLLVNEVTLRLLQTEYPLKDKELAKKILRGAIAANNIELMKQVCNRFDELKHLGLRYAADFGNVEAGKRLLSNGADIDSGYKYERLVLGKYKAVDDYRVTTENEKIVISAPVTRTVNVCAGNSTDYKNEEFYHLLCYTQLLKITEELYTVFTNKVKKGDNKFNESLTTITQFKENLITKYDVLGKNTDLHATQNKLTDIVKKSPLKTDAQLTFLEKIAGVFKKVTNFLGKNKNPVIATQEDAQKLVSLSQSKFFATVRKRSASVPVQKTTPVNKNNIRKTF